MDYALKNGCQQAKVNLYAGSNSSFELRDAKMDRLQQASDAMEPILPIGWIRKNLKHL